jgi:hypothetical protein
MEQIACSEMLACKIQRPGNYPEENVQHIEHGKCLKSKIFPNLLMYWFDTEHPRECYSKAILPTNDSLHADISIYTIPAVLKANRISVSSFTAVTAALYHAIQ